MHGASAGVLYPGWVATRIASAAYGGDPHVTALVSHVYKGLLGTAISPERIARGVVPAIERRAARVIIPGRWIPTRRSAASSTRCSTPPSSVTGPPFACSATSRPHAWHAARPEPNYANFRTPRGRRPSADRTPRTSTRKTP